MADNHVTEPLNSLGKKMLNKITEFIAFFTTVLAERPEVHSQ